MTTQLAPTPVFKAFDNNGLPLANGMLYSYIAGTTTPQATYTDSTGSTPNANPVVLNARGEANVWLNPTQGYKLVLTDSLGNQIWSVDGIIGPVNINQSLIPAADNTYSLGSTTAAWAQLYLGANHAPALNGGIIGYWPQTAAELAAGVTPTNYAYGPGYSERYGADATGATDSTMALQNALNANADVDLTPNGTFSVSPQNVNNPDGGNGVCLVINSGNKLHMHGATVQQKAGTTGSGCVIGNTAALTGVVVEGGTVDGNSANTTGNMNAVCLFNATDCEIRNVTAINARWIGIGFRNPGSPAISYGRNVIRDCTVNGSLYIGIQCNRPMLGIAVLDNIVVGTGDNAIDIEGNNTAGDPGYGERVLVRGNSCYSFKSGVFLESVGEAIIDGNTLQNFNAPGIYLNRTNSGALSVLVTNNRIVDGAGQAGVYVNNSSGKVYIGGNYFRALANSIFGNAGAAHVSVGHNIHENITSTLIGVPQAANSLVYARIVAQDYAGSRAAGVPFACSPLTNSNNYGSGATARAFAVICEGAYAMESGVAPAAASDDEYQNGVTGVLAANSAWSGAYATYTGGDTQVYTTSNPGVGNYVEIGGYLYYVYANPSGGVFTLRLVSAGNNQGTAGDYTAAPYNLDSAANLTGYYPQWQTT